jgi:sigma-B regulation protein RsbU (phosphoserine phosphatase)
MLKTRLPWQKELAIIDNTMKAISGITDPEELVETYWNGIGELITVGDYVALSRRNVLPPDYIITRSSRFTEYRNPWTQRDKLPRMSGGLLGEIAYANRPVIIDDLPSRLLADDPAHFYLQGFGSLVALPQYDGGESLNVTVMLSPPGDQIDPTMVPMLHWQSGLFGRGTQNLVLRNQLAAALAALDAELKTVGQIQRSLLPYKLPLIEGFELATYYQTSARAGGDYYDFFPLDAGKCGIFIADVSGHGTPAAVLMAITHAIAHAQPGAHTPPPALLQYLNDHLTRSYTRGGTFVTAFYAVLDPIGRTLTYSRAGHNPPRLIRHGQVLSLDRSAALPLGILSQEPYDQSELTLQSGDLLLLYTDGITEASAPSQGGSRRLFGVERLDEVLLNCGDIGPRQCIARIQAAMAQFCDNAAPNDDQTIIALQCA